MTSARIVSTFFTGALVLGCAERNIGGSGETTATTGGESGSGGGGSGATTTGDADPTTPTSESPTSGPPGSSSSPPDPSAGTMTGELGESGESDESGDSGINFIPRGDEGQPGCDDFAQDCPEGQKCAAWASDGGDLWNMKKCVEVTGDQKPGESCIAEGGGFSGMDDCVKGAMCWDVDAEDVGTCIALCTGTPDAPVCAEGFNCVEVAQGVLSVCLPSCDALLQDCTSGEVCIPLGDLFACAPDASGEEGQAFDPCEVANGCDPGLVCAGSASASECDPRAAACCVPMCSISAMMGCPGVGQQCVSLFKEGMAPPEFVDIGYCAVPV